MLEEEGSTKEIPFKIVGGTNYGRYSKISAEKTYNMYISDGWLVPFAGYRKAITNVSQYNGRCIYQSEKLGKIVACFGNEVYLIDKSMFKTKIANIDTYSGSVSIAENNANQIAIEDKKNIYIYNYSSGGFSKLAIDFTPAYIAFQDGYFIAADKKTSLWRLSELNNGLSFPYRYNTVGSIQTKPTKAKACIPIPGKGHQLFAFGETVTQHWTNIGDKLFPYQQTASFNIDYGCINQSTIGVSDTFVTWLGYNDKSGISILASEGGPVVQLSNEGINYKLSNLKHPEKSYGMMYKQDGHVFYILTFYDEDDNLSLAYDYSTQTFFNLCDKNMDCYPARSICFFNRKFYFVSYKDGNLYELDSDCYENDGEEIQRIRITPPIRSKDQYPFVVNNVGFTIEQGTTDYPMRVDISVSKDGGVTFGTSKGIVLDKKSDRKYKFIMWNLGYANDFAAQFRFHGHGRFVCADGLINIYR